MKLYVVGIGPGGPAQMTPRAREAVEVSDVLAGYPVYLDLLDSMTDGKELISTGMTGEVRRCTLAVEAALSGKRVSVVSGGDAGVYGMAGLVLELSAPHPELEVEVIPGVTAATAAAAVLGAPLGHDFAVISLSDLLTPWEKIEDRLRYAAKAGFLLCVYNPSSRKRADYLERACSILLETLPPDTPCGMVRNAGRADEASRVLTLEELRTAKADMFTTVIVGNESTVVLGGRLVTPRGYRL